MQIYFVRHGETIENRRGAHQHPQAALSERGRAEARAVGLALLEIPQPLLIASDLARAAETAEIIGKVMGLRPQLEPLFREMRRPSTLFGSGYFGFRSLTIGLQLFLHAPFVTWHYSDEENLHEVSVRVKKAVAYLEELAERYQHVIVVSHAMLMSLLFVQLRKGKISLFAYLLALFKLGRVANGSITRLTCVCEFGKCQWSIEAQNEVTHLTEHIKQEGAAQAGA